MTLPYYHFGDATDVSQRGKSQFGLGEIVFEEAGFLKDELLDFPERLTMGQYEESPDEDLLAWSVKGELAFEAFYHRHKQKLFGFVLQQLGDKDSAEIVFQNVMLAVRDGAKTFEGRANVSTWMCRIAKNKVIDFIRTRSRKEPNVVAIETIEDFVDPSESPSDRMEKKDLTDAMQRAIWTLSLEHRRVLYLTFHFYLSYQEVALVEGIPVGTVRSRLSLAKRKLADALAEGCIPARASHE